MVKADDVSTYPPEAQLALCQPSNNVDAAAFFITNFCLTQDEDMGGRIRSIPAKEFILRTIRTFDFKDPLTVDPLPPANVHGEKSRRMLFTWLACYYNLWAISFIPGYTARLISKNEDAVDDGGVRSTIDSMFGRMRFGHDHLPPHLRKPITFAYMRATNAEHDGFIVGGAPTKDVGRGGGYSRVWVDECAFLDWAESIHKAVDPACKFGKVYFSTVNGPDNLFARIKKDRPAGWRFLEVDWKDDPDKTEGLRETFPGFERDRFGSHVSPWFESVTSSLTDEMVAQEYGRNYQKSTIGKIHREFSPDLHVAPAGSLKYIPSLPLYIGIDFGHARKTSALIAQPVGMRKLRIIGEYSGEHRNSEDNATGLVKAVRALGYDGPLESISFVPDPAALHEELGTGLAPASWYRAKGFSTIVSPRIVGPDSVYLGNQVVRVLFGRGVIEIDGSIVGLIEQIPAYRYPVDRQTGEVKSNKPVHNMASHPCDALRYLVTSIWTADDLPYNGFVGVGENARGQVEIEREVATRDIGGVFKRSERNEDDPMEASPFRTIATAKAVF